ncbi:hypothetical protein BJ170DRAFT_581162 [Xylariales sp. AK1849]|nr:hypothetical protein BJ170DRAFT_581162 [Xylariales sp. AK1849]
MPPSDGDPAVKPAHLEPSELGTKEYWDALYTAEITNHAQNPSDLGTNWFDDSGAQDKVIDFLSEHFSSNLDDAQQTTAFLDLGTGNGELLFGLRDARWRGRILGVDYSERSDEDDAEVDIIGASEPVEFTHHDILATPPSALLAGEQDAGWDVVLDKGTFDAISLSSATDSQGRRVNEGYRDTVLQLVREGGLFLITSCNWTEEELEKWFVGITKTGENGFEKVARIEYRSFSFGGVKGQTISSLCFRKVRSG